jgi:L-alanine-DL-glutamate epimerase-like enolase superfamily enzyme
MRIVDIRERTLAISRYADPALPSGGLTTSIVALVTDIVRDGQPVVGYGFASFGRFGQGGLIEERFAPRIFNMEPSALLTEDGENLDPFRVWDVMMAGEKPGGHGERCVAVGTLDMAVWDAAAKIAGLPLHRFLSSRLGTGATDEIRVPVYAGGGYRYPSDDIPHLREEIRRFLDLGYERVKIKIGVDPLARDLARIEAVLALLPSADCLAVDAMNAFDRRRCLEVGAALAPYRLWWFEDACDPLDFETLGALAAGYDPPVAAGEALFSLAEARLLNRYGGLRPARDILQFDPVHCYGLPEYLRIVETLTAAGWPRSAFWPHGGHLFTLQVAAALGLGGSEVNPLCFQPFGGLTDDASVAGGRVALPSGPGIGFEAKASAMAVFRSLLA